MEELIEACRRISQPHPFSLQRGPLRRHLQTVTSFCFSFLSSRCRIERCNSNFKTDCARRLGYWHLVACSPFQFSGDHLPCSLPGAASEFIDVDINLELAGLGESYLAGPELNKLRPRKYRGLTQR